MPDDRPNILIVLADQHRRDAMGCYGNDQVHTPRFDDMARKGVRCNNGVSASPVCAPFRATLQSGLYAHQHGVVQNHVPLPSDTGRPMLAERFAAAGYNTCYLGKAHWNGADKPGFVPPERRLGWRHWRGHNCGHDQYDWPVFDDRGNRRHDHAGVYEPTAQTDYALDWIRGRDDTPWLMQLNWGPPHNATMNDRYAAPDVRREMKRLNRELGLGLSDRVLDDDRPDDPLPVVWFPQHLTGPLVPREHLDRYDPDAIALPPNVPESMRNLARHMLREYYAMVTSLDREMGRLLDHFADRRGGRDTIVLYLSDHGDFVGSHGRGRTKGAPYQCAFRTPLLAWGPNRIAAGAVTDAVVNSVDLLPTLLDLAGLPGDADPGVSQAAALTRGGAPEREPALLGMWGWRSLFDGRRCLSLEKGEDDEITQRLIDVVEDPHDLHDLCGDPAHADRAASMRRELEERLRREGDAFLETPTAEAT